MVEWTDGLMIYILELEYGIKLIVKTYYWIIILKGGTMNGWMDGWKDEAMDRQLNGWMNKLHLNYFIIGIF